MKKIFLVAFVLLFGTVAYGAHPLITDDAYTQGKGNIQVEVAGEYAHDNDTEKGVTTNGYLAGTAFIYGIADPVDIIIGSGYQNIRTNTDGLTGRNDGVSDTGIELKWKFYEKRDNVAFAIKSGIILPTGDDDKGLGSGKVRYRMFFVSTKEFDPFTVNLNIGYLRNENKNDERKDIIHASLSGEWKIIKRLKLVANWGIETNKDKDSVTDPAFILGGFMYSLTDKIDIDMGIKHGVTRTECHLTILAGITVKF